MATQILTVAIISGDKAKHITVGIGEAVLRLRVNTDSDMQSRQSGNDSDSTDCPGVNTYQLPAHPHSLQNRQSSVLR